MSDKVRYRLDLAATPRNGDVIMRLRQALKVLWRRFGLRLVDIRKVKMNDHGTEQPRSPRQPRT